MLNIWKKYFRINSNSDVKFEGEGLEGLVKALKEVCGEERFGIDRTSIKKSIYKMAKHLEGNTIKKDQKLYQTYSLLADVCHNSYYIKYLSVVSESNILTIYREVFANVLLSLIETIKRSVIVPNNAV